MRILIFATHHGEYSIGLAEALSDISETALYIDERELKNNCSKEQEETFTKKGILRPFSKSRPRLPFTFLSILISFFKFKPDIVIVHAHFDRFALGLYSIMSRFSRLYEIIHDPVPHTGIDSIHAAQRRWIHQRGRDLAHTFIVHGDFCLRQLEDAEKLRGRPVLNAPHGPILRPSVFSPPADPPFVLMFGRMEAYKGLDILLAAWQGLAARGTPPPLKLMGRGQELVIRKEAFEALGAEVRCEFVSRDVAVRALQDASVVLAPYTEATQSGVVAAAFAAGRPIIATAVGGLVDFVQNEQNGLLVPGQDPDALAGAVRRLIDDPALWRRLADGAARTIREDATWERYAQIIGDSWSGARQPV